MQIIKKHHYTNFLKCHKAFLYSFFNYKNIQISQEENKKNNDEFELIKKFAYKYFENTFDASGNNINISINDRISLTEQLVKNSEINSISNCSFLYNDLFCTIDILKKDKNSYSIYKIKPFSNIEKHIEDLIDDTSFQLYILQKNNLKIKNCYVLYLNKNYIRKGDIDIKKLFLLIKLNKKKLNSKLLNVEKNISKIKNIIYNYNNQEDTIYNGCDECCGNCSFFDFCHKNLPPNNVTEINGISKKYADKLIKNKIVTFFDLKKNNIIFKNFRKQIQIDTFLNKKDFYVDKIKLKKFLKTIKYPLYYLDFETINEAIPPFDNAKPYEQFPFQYSLHIETKKNSKLIHKNFLGNKMNCSYELAKQLINDIPKNSCIIAYNAIIEKNIIKKLSLRFPDLRNKLNNLTKNIIDLLQPFKKGFYYNARQGKSNSIKEVVGALCSKSKYKYQELSFIHNGFEASNMFKKIVNSLDDEEIIKKRQDMINYCSLDTINMSKILKILYKAIKR